MKKFGFLATMVALSVIVVAVIAMIFSLFNLRHIDGAAVEMKDGKAVSTKTGFYVKNPFADYLSYKSDYSTREYFVIDGQTVVVHYQLFFPVNDDQKLMSLADKFKVNMYYYDLENVVPVIKESLEELAYTGIVKKSELAKKLQLCFDTKKQDVEVSIGDVFFN